MHDSRWRYGIRRCSVPKLLQREWDNWGHSTLRNSRCWQWYHSKGISKRQWSSIYVRNISKTPSWSWSQQSLFWCRQSSSKRQSRTCHSYHYGYGSHYAHAQFDSLARDMWSNNVANGSSTRCLDLQSYTKSKQRLGSHRYVEQNKVPDD